MGGKLAEKAVGLWAGRTSQLDLACWQNVEHNFDLVYSYQSWPGASVSSKEPSSW